MVFEEIVKRFRLRPRHSAEKQWHVRAEVLTFHSKGQRIGVLVFAGANIENASSNLGLCAERVAIAHARMRSKATIEGLAIFCADAKRGRIGVPAANETFPCGACRQWIVELAPGAWIVTNGSAKVYSIDDFLPKPFLLPGQLHER